MFNLSKPAEVTALESMQLEELLMFLIQYGKPRVSYIDGGWYCKVEMNTNTKGTQFDVASEFGQPTPLHAVRMCHERINRAMKALGV